MAMANHEMLHVVLASPLRLLYWAHFILMIKSAFIHTCKKYQKTLFLLSLSWGKRLSNLVIYLSLFRISFSTYIFSLLLMGRNRFRLFGLEAFLFSTFPNSDFWALIRRYIWIFSADVFSNKVLRRLNIHCSWFSFTWSICTVELLRCDCTEEERQEREVLRPVIWLIC